MADEEAASRPANERTRAGAPAQGSHLRGFLRLTRSPCSQTGSQHRPPAPSPPSSSSFAICCVLFALGADSELPGSRVTSSFPHQDTIPSYPPWTAVLEAPGLHKPTRPSPSCPPRVLFLSSSRVPRGSGLALPPRLHGLPISSLPTASADACVCLTPGLSPGLDSHLSPPWAPLLEYHSDTANELSSPESTLSSSRNSICFCVSWRQVVHDSAPLLSPPATGQLSLQAP